MMDFEKKYNEALERARMYYNELHHCRAKEELEIIFPELRESEDERIRKAIIGLIEELQRSDKNFAGVELAEMLAYLEKQKEQKDCTGCSKHLEGYISGRTDAENKLLDQFGAVITPEGELRIRSRYEPNTQRVKKEDLE